MIKRILCQNFVKALLLVTMCGHLSALESANWFIGVGVGAGATNTNIKYPDSVRSGGLGREWLNWRNEQDNNITSWGVAYEILVGYKHFLNKYVGFRYYANVGAQHYKDANFSGNKDKIGVVDYTINADLLLNFYTSPTFSVGILGGFGVGGAFFDSPTIDNYENFFGGAKDSTQFRESQFAGEGDVSKNHFNASLSVGARMSFFGNVSAGQVVCRAGGDGRRSCLKPSSRLEHSIELNAKFPMLTYRATKQGDIMGAYCDGILDQAIMGLYKCLYPRPGYEIKVPYKFTLRYIIAF